MNGKQGVWLKPGQNRVNAKDQDESIVKGLCAHDPGAAGATEGWESNKQSFSGRKTTDHEEPA